MTMAGIFAIEESKRKNCKMCSTFVDPSAFQQGLTVFVESANKCEDCEVAKANPLPSNEEILFIYASLPTNWDGMTGLRIVTADDIYKTMELLEIPEELWCDYFQRITHYHNASSKVSVKRTEAEQKK